MAAQAAGRRRDRERRGRARDAILREHADQRQQVAAITHRNERAEQARELRARQEATAVRFDAETAAEIERLTCLLRTAAIEPARDLATIREAVPDEPAPTVNDVAAPPRPEWSQYAPPPPGLFGRRRYERAVATARAGLDEALPRHDRALASGLAQLTRQHEHTAAAKRHAHEAEWDAVASGVAAGDGDAVGTLAATSLQTSSALRGLIEGGRTTYDATARKLVLEIDIPDTDVVPREHAWKYVATRTSTVPVPARAAEVAGIYAGLVAQLVLAVLHTCFRSTGSDTVDAISVNVHVQTINPATGRPDHPCLITVTTDGATFAELDLRHPKLDPKACLRELGAEISPHPHDLHIDPIVDFEMAKYRIAYGPEALAKIDRLVVDEAIAVAGPVCAHSLRGSFSLLAVDHMGRGLVRHGARQE
jgi:restriction system protein